MIRRKSFAVFVAVFVLVVFSGPRIVFSEEASPITKSPLKLRFIVDPEFGNISEFGNTFIRKTKSAESVFEKIFSEASRAFRSEIGKNLMIISIEYAIYTPPPEKVALSLNTELIIEWLEKESKEHTGVIIVFVTNRFLLSPLNFKFWSGYGVPGFLFFRYYGYDIPYTIENFLHELGHACGADHSWKRDSVMNPDVYGVRTYGDKRAIIKQNCG